MTRPRANVSGESGERTVDPRRWTIRVCQHGHAERCGGIDCQEDKAAWRLVEVVEVLSKGSAGGSYRVCVRCAKGFRTPDIGVYCDECVAALAPAPDGDVGKDER